METRFYIYFVAKAENIYLDICNKENETYYFALANIKYATIDAQFDKTIVAFYS